MPVLRLPTDTTLAETLGNLGNSIGNAFDPLKRLQAYQIQQRIALEQQQIIQAQRENAAKQSAINQWGHIVPSDKLPQIANMIYQGAPYDQVARAAAQLSGNLVDDPNAMQQNIRYIEQLTGKPYDYATNGPPVAGPNTAKQANDWKVNQAGATAGATALGQKTGEQAAVAPLLSQLKDDTSPETTANNIRIMETINGKPWDNPYAPVVGPNTQQARNQSDATRAGQQATATAAGTETGKQTAAAPIVSQYVDADTPEANANNTRLYMIAHGGELPPDGLPPSVGPLTSAANQSRKSRQAGETSRETAVGTAVGGGVKPEGQVFPSGVPGSPGNPLGTTPASAPSATAPSATAPSVATPSVATPNVTLPNPSAPFAPPTQITRQTPAGVVVGQTPTETAASDAVTKARSDQLAQAITDGNSAVTLKTKLAQLRDLIPIINAKGATGQATAAALKAFGDKYGVTVGGDQGSALAAANQILSTEIPALRAQMGFRVLAGPELKAATGTIGRADMPPDVINNIIANEEAVADIQIARKANAQNAQGVTGTPMAFNDYTTADNDLTNSLQQRTNTLRTAYGAVGSHQAPPPPTTGPGVISWGDIGGAISRFLGGAQAGPPPAPAPGPAPAPAPSPDSRELRPGVDF